MKDYLRWTILAGIFAIPCVVFLVTESLFFPYITGKNFAFRIIVEIVFAAWVLLALYDPKYRPRFSWVSAALLGLVVVMFFANLFGEYPLRSFWSNFERMDGYVTLVHFAMYFLVLGSMLRENTEWFGRVLALIVPAIAGVWFVFDAFSNPAAAEGLRTAWPLLMLLVAAPLAGVLWWQTQKEEQLFDQLVLASLGVAVLLGWYAFAQFSGALEVSRGSNWRLDATLGNSTYYAIYLLFHTGLALLCVVRTSPHRIRILCALLAATFAFLIFQTGTRGTILGLVGGTLLTTLYVALFAQGSGMLRKVAVGALLALVVVGGIFWSVRDSAVVQEIPVLSRVANISITEGDIRFLVWGAAIQGIQERPILGWGQGNFNYVFNTYYNPELYKAEPWYDRVHNVVLDWLIAGGIVGALFYFSIIGAVLYYIVVRPLLGRKEDAFTVAERGILLGLLGAYVFHNLFVFDNVISYLFFAVVLAFVHSRAATEVSVVQAKRIHPQIISQIYAPVVGVALLTTLYVVNVPGILAAGDLIDALRARDAETMSTEFGSALSRGSFADQEIRQQLLSRTVSILTQPDVSAETKQTLYAMADDIAEEQVLAKPYDARVYLLTGSFYRGVGVLEEADRRLTRAAELAPNKQAIYIEHGMLAIQQEDYARAHGYFKTAYELLPEYTQAAAFYALGAALIGETDVYESLIADPDVWEIFVSNNAIVQIFFTAERYEVLQRVLETRIAAEPNNVQHHVHLAVMFYQSGDVDRAIAILEEAAAENPAFAEDVQGVIRQMRAGAIE